MLLIFSHAAVYMLRIIGIRSLLNPVKQFDFSNKKAVLERLLYEHAYRWKILTSMIYRLE